MLSQLLLEQEEQERNCLIAWKMRNEVQEGRSSRVASFRGLVVLLRHR